MPAKGADSVAKRGVLTGKTGVVVEIRSHVDEGWSRFEVLTGLPRKRGTVPSCAVIRGHPLADLRQASKQFHGGIGRQYFQSQFPIN